MVKQTDRYNVAQPVIRQTDSTVESLSFLPVVVWETSCRRLHRKHPHCWCSVCLWLECVLGSDQGSDEAVGSCCAWGSYLNSQRAGDGFQYKFWTLVSPKYLFTLHIVNANLPCLYLLPQILESYNTSVTLKSWERLLGFWKHTMFSLCVFLQLWWPIEPKFWDTGLWQLPKVNNNTQFLYSAKLQWSLKALSESRGWKARTVEYKNYKNQKELQKYTLPLTFITLASAQQNTMTN